MKMMSSTSITSMRGVMLMSDIAPDVRGLGGLVGVDDPAAVPAGPLVPAGGRALGCCSAMALAPCTFCSAMSAISSTPASRQRSMTFMTSE